MTRTITAVRDAMGPWVFALWAIATAFACGHVVARIVTAAWTEQDPSVHPYYPPTEDWQCGLDRRDYLPGNCGNPEAITFCVGARCRADGTLAP